MPRIVFREPFYTNTVRNYVSVPMPTGEYVSLVDDDGEVIVMVREPGSNWPRALANAAHNLGFTFTESEIEDMPAEEAFDSEL